MLDLIIGTFISLTTFDWWIVAAILLGISYLLLSLVWQKNVAYESRWTVSQLSWLSPNLQRVIEQVNALPRQFLKHLTDAVTKLPLLIPLVATVVLIGAGQFAFDQTAEPSSTLGILLLAGGVLAIWLTAYIEQQQIATANLADTTINRPTDNFDLANFFRRSSWRGFLLTVSLLACLASAQQARELENNFWAALAWVLAIASFLLACGVPSIEEVRSAFTSRSPQAWATIALALGSLGFGIVLRFYRLDLPAVGMEQDAANFGVSVLRLLQGEQLYIFGGQWFFGVSAIYTYLQAGSVLLFGPTETGLGLVSAILGGLNLVFVFLLLHHWFGSGLATIATLLLAVAPHHLYYSRTGENNLVLPLFMTATLYFLSKGLQTKGPNLFALAGVFYGVGLWWDYNNKSLHMYPILVFILVYWTFTQQLKWRVDWQLLGVALVGTLLVLLPVWSVLAKLDSLWVDFSHGHSLLANIDQAQHLYDTNSLFVIIAHQAEYSILGISHINPNIFSAPWRMLDSLTAVFFFIGLGYSFSRWKDIRYGTGLVWWLVGLQGSIWSNTPPLSHRLVLILVPTYILAAIGLDKVLSLLSISLNWKHPVYATTLTTLIVGGLIYINLNFYFDPHNYPLTWLDVAEAGKAIKQYQDSHQVYFLGMPSTYAVGHGTIRWYSELAADRAIDAADTVDIVPFKQPPDRPIAIIALPANYDDLDQIETLYPGGLSHAWQDKVHNSGIYLRSYELTVQQANNPIKP